MPQLAKNPPAMWETWVQSLGWEDPLEKGTGTHPSILGEGNGNPLQCSCLENSRDGGALWAAVYGVAQSRTRLKRLSSSSRVLPNNFIKTSTWQSNGLFRNLGNLLVTTFFTFKVHLIIHFCLSLSSYLYFYSSTCPA